jgi:hypothetical protein
MWIITDVDIDGNLVNYHGTELPFPNLKPTDKDEVSRRRGIMILYMPVTTLTK